MHYIGARIPRALCSSEVLATARLRPRHGTRADGQSAAARADGHDQAGGSFHEGHAGPAQLLLQPQDGLPRRRRPRRGGAALKAADGGVRQVQVLDSLRAGYGAFNVLMDPEVREGVKTYSNWPTIPQLYVKGEFIGGCDIVMEMHQSGELLTLLKEAGAVK